MSNRKVAALPVRLLPRGTRQQGKRDYQNKLPQVAVEVKWGIDPAGVLERIGAALKSLQRTRQENLNSVTVLILQDVSMTERAKEDLNLSTGTVTYLFSAKAVLEDQRERERLFRILDI